LEAGELLILFLTQVNPPERTHPEPVAFPTSQNEERNPMGHTKRAKEHPEQQLFEQLERVPA
jgi:hypothetical protein